MRKVRKESRRKNLR